MHNNLMKSVEVENDKKECNKVELSFLNSNGFADLRIKMGTKKPFDSLLPDEISEDHWAELNNHAYRLHCEDQEKKKQEILNKRSLVRDTLQKQLEEQRVHKQKYIQYNKNIDTLMLNNAKKELDAEKKKAREMKKKVEL